MLLEFRNFMVQNVLGRLEGDSQEGAGKGDEEANKDDIDDDDDNNNHLSSPTTTTTIQQSPPYTIVFSIGSSKTGNRFLTFEKQIASLEQAFSSDRLQIVVQQLSRLSLEEQVQLASRAALYVTICGGGAVTATFLPPGATVLIYYDEDGGYFNNKPTKLPARLDWDLFNNAAYLKVHWLPTGSMDQPDDLELMTDLVRSALDELDMGD